MATYREKCVGALDNSKDVFPGVSVAMNKRSFLIFFASIQIAFIGTIIINLQNFGFSFLQTIMGVPYVLLFPGYLIAINLNLQRVGVVKLCLYSFALSLSIIMALGFILNTLLPTLGIAPFSSLIMTVSIILLTVLLGIISLKRINFLECPRVALDLKSTINPYVLAAILLLFISITGSSAVNYFNIFIGRWIFYFVFAIFVFLVLFAKRVSVNQRATIIFLISLSLLYQTIFLSSFLFGQDIHLEDYIMQNVLNSGIWITSIPINVNAMLSITVLGPYLSSIPNITSTSALMFVYPIIFSLVPVCLYFVWMGQTNEKIAYIAVIFFVSLFIFYGEMLQLARQEIAELFFAVFLLALFDSKLEKLTKKMLLIIFFLSVIVSHYGTAYIAIGFLIGSLAVNWFIEYIPELRKYMSTSKIGTNSIAFSSPKKTVEYTGTLVLLFLVFAIGWYAYNSSATNLDSIGTFFNNLISSIMDETVNTAPQGMAIVTINIDFLHTITKALQLLFQLLIMIGFLLVVIGKSKWKFHSTYLAISSMALLVLGFSLFLPYFASAFNTTRIYQISLILLAPFFAVAILGLFDGYSKIITKLKPAKRRTTGVNFIIGILLVCFILMNSGTVYELLNDNPTPIRESTSVDTLYFNNMEILGARWICQERVNYTMYADDYRRYLIGNFDWIHSQSLSQGYPNRNSSYIFLGYYNLINDEVLVTNGSGALTSNSYVKISHSFEMRNVIYRSNGAEVYL